MVAYSKYNAYYGTSGEKPHISSDIVPHQLARRADIRKFIYCAEREIIMFCNGCNNSTLWIIILIIILFGWGGNGYGCGCGNNCGCGCDNNNCGCGC